MRHNIFFTWFKKATIAAVAACALVFTVASCDPGIAEVQNAQLQLQEGAGIEQDYAIPLASKDELSVITKNGDGTLDYRIARKTAIIEFETGYRVSIDLPKGVRLSERPVVIYNVDSKPEIYEFFILQDGKPVGTVSTYAHTKYPEIIRNVLPFVRDYEPYTTKYSGYKQINDYYPMSVYVGVVSKSGGEVSGVIDPATGEGEAPPRIAEPATKPQEIQTAEAVAKIYWEIVLEHADEILAMTDEELYATLETKGYTYKYKDHTYMAKKFNKFRYLSRHSRARTRWNGWCVPSALAQMIWVWGDQRYGGKDLPNVDEDSFLTTSYRKKKGNTGSYEFFYDIEGKGRENKNSDGTLDPLVDKDAIRVLSKKIDNGLYYDLVNASNVGSNWDGGVYIKTGAEAVKKVTNGQITYNELWSKDGLSMHRHIKDRDEPLIDSIRTSKKGGHARLLVGTQYYWYEHWNVWHTYYWYIKRWHLKWGWLWTAEWAQGSHRWETSILSGEWGTKFLVWDNGYETKSHGNVSYWENNTATANNRKGVIGFKY